MCRMENIERRGLITQLMCLTSQASASEAPHTPKRNLRTAVSCPQPQRGAFSAKEICSSLVDKRWLKANICHTVKITKERDADHQGSLVWSRGEVNESLVANADNLNNGLLLQDFYKQCSFLPSGSGSMAGETFANGQYRWASGGEELLMQIRSLNNKSQKPVPLELQALYFKTVVCIPLQNGAGVLEIGTNELVRENDGMLSQILKLIDGLACQGTSRGWQIMMSSPFEAGSKVLQNDVGNPYGDPNEQYNKSASMKETYGSRVLLRHPSTSSSLHWSPSSTTSSSTPSANDQRGDSSNTSFLLPTRSNEDKLMSPADPLQATATSMVNSLDELHILKNLDQIDMRGADAPTFLQELDNYRLNYPPILAPSQDHHLHINDFPTLFSPTDVIASSALPSLLDSRQHAPPHSESNSDINYLFDYMLQPMQCAYSVGNEQANAHHSLNEVVGGSSKEQSMECQIRPCKQSQVSSISCLPSVTSQFASHSASYTNNQQQQWGPMFSNAKEGKGMTNLFGQSEQHTHAMGTADYGLADNSEETNLGHEIMLKQDAALAMVDEGSTSKNRRLTTRVSSTNPNGHEPFINDKMSTDKGKRSAVLSTAPLTNQAVGSYISDASGSAEPDKVVGRSPSQGSYASYDSNAAEDYKVVGSSVRQSAGSYASYASDSARVYRVVDSRTSPSAGSYVSFISGSAEAEKVVGTSAVISSRQGAGSLLGSGNRDDQNRAQHGGRDEFLDLQQLQGVKDDQYKAPNFANMGLLQESKVLNFAKSSSPAQNEAAVHHMHAERNRRRKQGHCIDTLRTLVPTITKKYPKVAILESTVQHLKELKDRICELEQENVALRILKLKDQQRELTEKSSNFVSNQKDATNVKSSTNISFEENAVCHYIDSSSVDDRNPHFQLSLIKDAQDVTANATIIEILKSLQAKNLCYYEIDSEFFKNTNKLSINILAYYKDGGNYSPSLKEIQDINDWWKHLSKD